MAIQPAIARQNGRGSSHCNSISSLQWRNPFFADSLLTPGSGGCKWSTVIVRRAGLPCTRMTLAPRALPFSSSQGPVREKNSGAEDLSSRWLASSHRLSIRAPRCHREGIRLSSSPNLISVPPRLRAMWSRSVWATMNWMTAFLWQLQMRKCNLPLSASRSARLKADDELICMMTKAVKELGLEWSPSRSRLDCFLPGAIRLSANARPLLPRSAQRAHEILTHALFVSYPPLSSAALTSIDGAEEKGYENLDESVAANLCPSTAIAWKARATHPSKPCRATSALAGRAYSAAGHAASTLH